MAAKEKASITLMELKALGKAAKGKRACINNKEAECYWDDTYLTMITPAGEYIIDEADDIKMMNDCEFVITLIERDITVVLEFK